ncbi:MAG: ATPase, T2SS/T4P/T4SS family [Candidatus Woesearchaeota archaeon]
MAKTLQIDSYKIEYENLVVSVDISLKEEEFVPTYSISILNISPMTNIILEKIKEEFITKVSAGTIEELEKDTTITIQQRFKKEIVLLIDKYFPHINQRDKELLVSYIMRENIGLGNIEILLKDKQLEEIVVNSAKECVWIYHKKHGWLKTNVKIPTESRIRHYSTMIGRDVQKEITLLKPLLDAHLASGERVNATLMPVSPHGNTITIRKFSDKPWTIVDFLTNNTISYEAAALLWLAVQNELSVLISGGTATGKTSTLNVVCNFFPPNQRIISIEDTQEIVLPKNLHWVPMETRLPNPEGKGEVSMLDLLVNSLRMRPDRIIVGEIRRQKEAEVLFEAMHTGHSVYATIHANDARETIVRLTNPPINIPKMMIPAISLVLVQSRNRRTGTRKTLQIAEITSTGDYQLLYQYDARADQLKKVNQWGRLAETLCLFTGLSQQELMQDLEKKEELLKYLVSKNITDINQLGLFFAQYYSNRLTLKA